MMRNSILLTILALSLVFGCVTVEYDHKVDGAGDSVITQTIDMSALIALGEQSGAEPLDMSDMCENVTAGVDCKVDSENSIITLSKSVKAGDGYYEFTKSAEFPNTFYTLEIDELPELMESDESTTVTTPTKFTDSDAATSAAMLAAAGMEVTYVIEMPGEIYEAEHGKIKDNKAEYDVLELMEDGNTIEVKSQELDLLMVGILVVVVLVIIAAVAFFLLKRG
jgi:hypothetical protein